MSEVEQRFFEKTQNVSRETMQRLCIYEDLLQKWTAKINLIAKSTANEVWSRHFLDSAQVFSEIPKTATSLSDFGSGGGFPGLVIAAIASEKSPNLKITLVESDLRKASFLMTAAREMGVQVDVLAKRVEAVDPLKSDVVTARALAPLSNLFEMAELHLKQQGTALFLKGENHEAELDTARKMWDFQEKRQQSVTNEASALLTVTDLKRVA